MIYMFSISTQIHLITIVFYSLLIDVAILGRT